MPPPYFQNRDTLRADASLFSRQVGGEAGRRGPGPKGDQIEGQPAEDAKSGKAGYGPDLSARLRVSREACPPAMAAALSVPRTLSRLVSINSIWRASASRASLCRRTSSSSLLISTNSLARS